MITDEKVEQYFAEKEAEEANPLRLLDDIYNAAADMIDPGTAAGRPWADIDIKVMVDICQAAKKVRAAIETALSVPSDAEVEDVCRRLERGLASVDGRLVAVGVGRADLDKAVALIRRLAVAAAERDEAVEALRQAEQIARAADRTHTDLLIGIVDCEGLDTPSTEAACEAARACVAEEIADAIAALINKIGGTDA